MPDLPDGLNVIGPDDACLGYLQLAWEGAERTLCDLPLQPHWAPRAPEDWRTHLPCLGCLRVLEAGAARPEAPLPADPVLDQIVEDFGLLVPALPDERRSRELWEFDDAE
jgi:hypothetical protein